MIIFGLQLDGISISTFYFKDILIICKNWCLGHGKALLIIHDKAHFLFHNEAVLLHLFFVPQDDFCILTKRSDEIIPT